MKKHKVLERQLKRYQLTEAECPTSLKKWQSFLDRINLAYEALDEDRYLSERIQEVSTKEMQELNKKLVTAARMTGMAEVATSVLHNIGNVLNSLNVSLSILKEKMQISKAANLRKIAKMLEDNKNNLDNFLTNDEKGRYLIKYIKKLSLHLEEENRSYIKELKVLENNIEHIKKIVAQQQNISGKKNFMELFSLIDVIEEALNVIMTSIAKHNILIIKKYDSQKQIFADKIKVHQILINLINNAKDAVIAENNKNKQIILRVFEADNSILLQVTDNGIGIDKKNIKQIFSFGYTTKQGGHGFGLHASFLAAEEMGAILSANSKGLGKGSTFTLEFPLKE